MQRVCTRCNTLVTTDGAFCPSCGEPLPAAVELKKETQSVNSQTVYSGQSLQPNYGAPAQQNYNQTSFNQQGYTEHQGTMPNYNTSYNAAPISASTNNSELTLGQWVGTILLCTMLGLISIILCIVWAVGNDVPIAKKRYCQAMLIVYAISFAIGILFSIIFGAIIGSILPEIIAQLEAYEYAYSALTLF